MPGPIIATLLLLFLDEYLLLGEKLTGRIGKGMLNGPGGGCEVAETPLECIIREAFEELGLVLLPEDLEHVAYLDCYAAGNHDLTVHVFIARTFTGEPHATDQMIPYWFPVDNLPYERMHAADPSWLPRILAGERFSASIHYERPGEGFTSIDFFPY